MPETTHFNSGQQSFNQNLATTDILSIPDGVIATEGLVKDGITSLNGDVIRVIAGGDTGNLKIIINVTAQSQAGASLLLYTKEGDNPTTSTDGTNQGNGGGTVNGNTRSNDTWTLDNVAIGTRLWFTVNINSNIAAANIVADFDYAKNDSSVIFTEAALNSFSDYMISRNIQVRVHLDDPDGNNSNGRNAEITSSHIANIGDRRKNITPDFYKDAVNGRAFVVDDNDKFLAFGPFQTSVSGISWISFWLEGTTYRAKAKLQSETGTGFEVRGGDRLLIPRENLPIFSASN